MGKEELTFEAIQKACLKHFAPKIGPGMYCDVLAGEQGPSCSSLQQIPDTKLIHIRFTNTNDHICDNEDERLVKAPNKLWFLVFQPNVSATAITC